jgi:predicted nucleic acid-binding Zn ribbon protein
MEKAGNFLGGMLRQIKRPEAVVAWLSSVWPSIVGKTLAAHTRPVRCQAGCLEIAADNKAWQKQLEQMKPEFCAQVNKAWGSTLIREVKFAASKPGPRKLPREMDNEHTPFIRRRKS